MDLRPGCGGCLLILILLLLALSGWQAVGEFILLVLLFGGMGFVLFLFLFSIAIPWYIRKRATVYAQSQTAIQNRFVFLLVNILVSIAKTDGQLTQSELKTMLNFFQYSLHYNQDQMYWVKQLIREAKDSRQDLEALLQEFRSTFAHEPRLILLDLIYQIIYSKIPVQTQRLELVRRIAAFLQISVYEWQRIENKYHYGQQPGSTSTKERPEKLHATVLGVPEDADFATIKKAYRQLSMQYHPDKVAHLGAEFKRIAEEKMKEINVAYDYFRKKFERG
jgi:DnaJ like chaperone protein